MTTTKILFALDLLRIICFTLSLILILNVAGVLSPIGFIFIMVTACVWCLKSFSTFCDEYFEARAKEEKAE